MQSENTRRIIRNVLVVGGIVVAVILVFLLIRALFTAGGQSSAPQSEMSQPLLNTSVDRGVKMTVRGPIVANENARSYEVDITPTSRSVTQYSGYDGTVVNKQVYSNSPAAYTQLVYALDKAGMTNSRDAQNTDTRGVCATGQLYTFALERDTDIESSLWTSSCRSDQGTLNVRPGNLRNLFDLQIPDILKYSGSL